MASAQPQALPRAPVPLPPLEPLAPSPEPPWPTGPAGLAGVPPPGPAGPGGGRRGGGAAEFPLLPPDVPCDCAARPE